MKCHYINVRDVGKVLIPGCMAVAVSNDIERCTCYDILTEKDFERQRYKTMLDAEGKPVNYNLLKISTMDAYSTEHGTECTSEECKAIAALSRAIAKWNKNKGKRLFLYVTGDGINVMMHECGSNPISEDDNFGGMSRENIVTLIPVRDIDCGDW